MTPAWVLIGGGGHGRSVLDALLARLSLERPYPETLVGILDDRLTPGQLVHGVPVLGGPAWLDAAPLPLNVVVAVGENHPRARWAAEARARCPDVAFPPVVHPSAFVSPRAALGEGCVVLGGAQVVTGASLGRFCLVNTNAGVDHDCRLADFSSVAPGASLGGGVVLGEGAAVGLGAAVSHGRTVGPHAVVGAGAVVVRDVPGYCVAYGSPVRVIRAREPGDPYL